MSNTTWFFNGYSLDLNVLAEKLNKNSAIKDLLYYQTSNHIPVSFLYGNDWNTNSLGEVFSTMELLGWSEVIEYARAFLDIGSNKGYIPKLTLDETYNYIVKFTTKILYLTLLFMIIRSSAEDSSFYIQAVPISSNGLQLRNLLNLTLNQYPFEFLKDYSEILMCYVNSKIDLVLKLASDYVAPKTKLKDFDEQNILQIKLTAKLSGDKELFDLSNLYDAKVNISLSYLARSYSTNSRMWISVFEDELFLSQITAKMIQDKLKLIKAKV